MLKVDKEAGGGKEVLEFWDKIDVVGKCVQIRLAGFLMREILTLESVKIVMGRCRLR